MSKRSPPSPCFRPTFWLQIPGFQAARNLNNYGSAAYLLKLATREQGEYLSGDGIHRGQLSHLLECAFSETVNYCQTKSSLPSFGPTTIKSLAISTPCPSTYRYPPIPRAVLQPSNLSHKLMWLTAYLRSCLSLSQFSGPCICLVYTDAFFGLQSMHITKVRIRVLFCG